MDIKQFLRTLPTFEGAGEGELEHFAQSVQVGTYPRGHQFNHAGEPGDGMYLLLEGDVRLTQLEGVPGEPAETRDLHPGDMFGLLALVDEMPALTTGEALTPVRAAVLSHYAYQQLAGSAPDIARQLRYMIAIQLARDLQARNRALRALLKRQAAAGTRPGRA